MRKLSNRRGALQIPHFFLDQIQVLLKFRLGIYRYLQVFGRCYEEQLRSILQQVHSSENR